MAVLVAVVVTAAVVVVGVVVVVVAVVGGGGCGGCAPDPVDVYHDLGCGGSPGAAWTIPPWAVGGCGCGGATLPLPRR